MPILQCKDASKSIKDGEEVEVILEKGIIKNKTTGRTLHGEPPSNFVLKLIDAGGIVEFVKNNDIEELN